MSEDTKETTFGDSVESGLGDSVESGLGDSVESDPEVGNTRVSKEEAVSIFHDDDDKIDDQSTITLGHTESGEWVWLGNASEVRETTKADALEAVADELRKNQD